MGEQQSIIALINFDKETLAFFHKLDLDGIELMPFINATELISIWQVRRFNIVAIISNSEILNDGGINADILIKKKLPRTPIFLLVTHFNPNVRQIAMDKGITDVFVYPLIKEEIETRVNFNIAYWSKLQQQLQTKAVSTYKTPIGKRIFDVVSSGVALILLSPIFLLIYILVRLESKGPAFYYSFRVGTGYRVFKFYKFRSMFLNADQLLKELKHLNQYDTGAEVAEAVKNERNLCSDCALSGKCQFPLYADATEMCEKDYNSKIKGAAGSAFMKIKDDPRVTKVGAFIRNTSIDELPQLWNVFIGNMSIVGNRPLPLYEAEKLTTDKNALRFNAPAGITGLWQVEKRGKSGTMSEEERLFLDNSYALNHSFKNDLRVILKTFPALFQKENV
jgi:lipopolysaccharide/colanic/teichoic acid biosynthesis glycosyltransferase